MIDRNAIASILDQYKEHGWTLRRVLLSAPFREADPKVAETVFDGAELYEADVDAAWFSRSSRPGLTAWELRHLSAMPYALLETIRDGTAPDEVERVLHITEERLIEALSKRRSN